MSTKTILVTGGAGFIGSNLISYLHSIDSSTTIVNLDKLTYAANLDYLKDLSQSKRYIFEKGDICDRTFVDRMFNEYNFEKVYHLAAESHVDNSIDKPDDFIMTNIVGTFTLLEVARNNWVNKEGDLNNNRFLHVSTDEVYGSLGPTGYFTEKTPLMPNSPYSASKASSDLIVRSYHQTYGMNVVTTNCSNNYGPRQHEEKLIPVIINKALKGVPIPIYGDGSNVRDWLFVEDHCVALEQVMRAGKAGGVYNIGGNEEWTNLELCKKVLSLLDTIHPSSTGSYCNLITFVTDRLGHDKRYAVNSEKIQSELNWKASESIDTGLRKTLQWYLENHGEIDAS